MDRGLFGSEVLGAGLMCKCWGRGSRVALGGFREALRSSIGQGSPHWRLVGGLVQVTVSLMYTPRVLRVWDERSVIICWSKEVLQSVEALRSG
jgi:hypothetical protein